MSKKEQQKTEVATNVFERNQFFLIGKKRLNYAIIISLIFGLTSFYLNWYTSKLEQNFYYFSATENGQFKKLVRNKDPLHDDDFIKEWSSKAMRDVFDFNYLNYRSVLNRYSNIYFSDKGRRSLIGAMKESETIKLIVDKKMILTISVDSDAAFIKKKGQHPKTGIHMWRVVVPATITYTENSLLSYVNDVEVTLTIERRSLLEDDTGLAISKLLIAIVK